MVLPLIQGNQLEGYINGSIIAPPRQVPSSSLPAMLVNNPEYDDWFATDHILLGWLRNTMTQDVGTH